MSILQNEKHRNLMPTVDDYPRRGPMQDEHDGRAGKKTTKLPSAALLCEMKAGLEALDLDLKDNRWASWCLQLGTDGGVFMPVLFFRSEIWVVRMEFLPAEGAGGAGLGALRPQFRFFLFVNMLDDFHKRKDEV